MVDRQSRGDNPNPPRRNQRPSSHGQSFSGREDYYMRHYRVVQPPNAARLYDEAVNRRNAYQANAIHTADTRYPNPAEEAPSTRRETLDKGNTTEESPKNIKDKFKIRPLSKPLLQVIDARNKVKS
jgi:hypothetical protein